MNFSFKVEFTMVLLVQALLTGVILAIIGQLTSVPFDWLQIIIVMVVVIIASFLAQLFGGAITANFKPM
jgi:hypothetical protein